MSSLIGSIGVRVLISSCCQMAFKQAVLFNAIDMAISQIVNEKFSTEAILPGRIFACTTAFLITSAVFGPVNAITAIALNFFSAWACVMCAPQGQIGKGILC